jgi:glycosyltransferase involved in cell wall biosynthesis
MLISVTLPFYNEEGCVGQVVSELHRVLLDFGRPFEIVAVQNGSADHTAAILSSLMLELPYLRVETVRINRGFGFGVRAGLAACRGNIIGFMPGDGQIPSSSVPRLIAQMEDTGAVVAQGRRVIRRDGFKRIIISWVFNAITKMLFAVQTSDVNGHPKFMRRDAYEALDLQSYDSFLDAEILLKATRVGMKLCEIPLEFLKRETGSSAVRWWTCAEFLFNLFDARFDPNDRWGFNKISAFSPVGSVEHEDFAKELV